LTVAEQHPLEAISRQPLHRIGLLRPRIPAIILGRRKLFRVSVPIQMVAREEEALAQEQHTMPLGVAGRLDCEEAWRQFPRPFPMENDFRAGLRRQFVAMDNAPSAKMLSVALGIGHVVPRRRARDSPVTRYAFYSDTPLNAPSDVLADHGIATITGS